jgi:hypothetical protein
MLIFGASGWQIMSTIRVQCGDLGFRYDLERALSVHHSAAVGGRARRLPDRVSGSPRLHVGRATIEQAITNRLDGHARLDRGNARTDPLRAA